MMAKLIQLTYVFTDGNGKQLGTAHQNERISFEIDEPTTITVHLGRGFKDAKINYVPGGTKKYQISQVNTLFGAHVSIQEVDVFDSDN